MPHDDSSAGREVHNGVTGNGGGSIKRRGAAARGDDRQALRALGRTGVTFAEWDICVAAGACPKIFDNGWGRGDRPVILVSWEEAQGYVRWLKRITGRDYRLFSEAEWEYAARAGNQGRWPFGDDEAQLGDYAWFTIGGSSNRPSAIGSPPEIGATLWASVSGVRLPPEHKRW